MLSDRTTLFHKSPNYIESGTQQTCKKVNMAQDAHSIPLEPGVGLKQYSTDRILCSHTYSDMECFYKT